MHISKTNIVLIILVAAFLVTAVVTNPSKDDYLEWEKSISIRSSSSSFGDLFVATVGSLITDASITANSYVLFTIFKQEILGHEKVSLGIFGMIIPIYEK